MARDSLTINYEQFYSLYCAVELQWSNTEALRLAAWLTSQAVPDFYQKNIPIEMASGKVIEQTLNRLWGSGGGNGRHAGDDGSGHPYGEKRSCDCSGWIQQER